MNSFKDFKLQKEDLSMQKIQYLLNPSFINETTTTTSKQVKETFIFVNDINLILHHAKINNAIVKIRKQLCKDLSIDYIDIDYFEVISINIQWKETRNNLDNIEKQVEDYLKMKLIKYNIQNYIPLYNLIMTYIYV